MDNFHINITSEGKEQLQRALEIVCNTKWSVRKITHYALIEKYGLVFYSATMKEYPPKDKEAVALPFTLDAAGAADFAWRWLQETADYGPEPDHDGDNGKGWRVYNESWGRVGNDYHAIVAIAPEWAWYGK